MKLSDYTRASYDPDEPHPLTVGTRASTGAGHDFGDVGEVSLTEEETRRLTVLLAKQYDEEAADKLHRTIFDSFENE